LSYLIDEIALGGKLLRGHEPSPVPVSVVYPSQCQVPLNLRAFLDFSIPRLREWLQEFVDRVWHFSDSRR
jgi:hypothetical protein